MSAQSEPIPERARLDFRFRRKLRSVIPLKMKILPGLFTLAALAASAFAEDKLWVTYEGKEGAGKGKQIVFLSGDEEYRSEEGLPQLAKFLSQRHGFKCTVLFSIDPKTG